MSLNIYSYYIAVLALLLWVAEREYGKADSPRLPPSTFHDDDVVSLPPGESRTIQIEYAGSIAPDQTKLVVDG